MNYYERPEQSEHSAEYGRYIGLVKEANLLEALTAGMGLTIEFFSGIPEERWSHRYAEGKWDIRGILGHMMDTERIFAYRALCIARGETQPLPGYDENLYAVHSNASRRGHEELLQEYATIRTSTIHLFQGLDPNDLLRKGTANARQLSVRAIGYIIAGHELHHMQVIRERYL